MKKYNVQNLINKLNDQYVEIYSLYKEGNDINQNQIVADVFFKAGYLYSEVIKLNDQCITQAYNVLMYNINTLFNVEREKGIIEELEK